MMALAKFVLVSQYNYIFLDEAEDIGAQRIVIYTFVLYRHTDYFEINIYDNNAYVGNI